MKTHLKNIIEGVEERPKQRTRKLNRCSDVSILHLPHFKTYENFFRGQVDLKLPASDSVCVCAKTKKSGGTSMILSIDLETGDTEDKDWTLLAVFVPKELSFALRGSTSWTGRVKIDLLSEEVTFAMSLEDSRKIKENSWKSNSKSGRVEITDCCCCWKFRNIELIPE